ESNRIGTDLNGTAAASNSVGIIIDSSSNNTIGGTNTASRNVISGNQGNGGIFISNSSGNRVIGNYIGTDVSGMSALPNTFGISIFSAGNFIGGTTPAERNVISGNFTNILASGGPTTVIHGNFIGTNKDGTGPLGSSDIGIEVEDPTTIGGTIGTTPGGPCTGACNLISGNGTGVLIRSDAVSVKGNYIGTDVTGTVDVGNLQRGVFIEGKDNVVIGGQTPAARNVISGNNGDGVTITADSVGIGADGCEVEGNFIGTSANGMQALGNGTGVQISFNATGNTIGGNFPGAGNIISGNAIGVFLTGSGTTQNQVQGNYIGTKANGAEALGNSFFGVRVNAGSSNNTIGGAVAASRNIISANGTGVRISDQTTMGNKIHGNYIGADTTGTADLGNANEGVFLDNAPNNFIGGTATGEGNLISGNDASGVRILDDKATGNRVEGNLIGTKVNGTEALANSSHGVYLRNVSNNRIGGTTSGARNQIGFNGGDGIFIEPANAPTNANAVLSNAIFANAGLGIDLFPDGVTANDAGDADTGANNLQNFPVLTSAISFPSSTTAIGTLNSTASTTFLLEFYSNASCDPSSNGEGQTFLGNINRTTDAGGNLTFNRVGMPAIPAGRFITATATDPTGNTSEFSQCLQARAANADLSINMFDSPDPVGAGSTLTYTVTLTNNGPERAESIVVTDNLPAEVTFISCTAAGGGVCGGTGNSRTVTFSSLAPGDMVNITLVTGVNSSVSGVTISNTAMVSSAATDPNPNNNSVTITTTVPATIATLQLSAASYSVVEDCTRVSVTVTRSGPVTSVATVDYATGNATATERSDYTTALGRLRFAAGEITKSFDVLINEDSYVEGTETATVLLSNPVGAVLTNPSTATLEIVDDTSEPATNPIDDARNFACQNYHDFLNRQPDDAGLDFWTNQITECGTDAQCIELKRINVSAAFFLSIEFQETGYLVYRFHQTAFNTGPRLGMREFLADTQEIGRGVVVGAPGWEQQLEANKQAYANVYAGQPQFVAQYPISMTAAQFVDALNANTLDPLNPAVGGSLSMDERDQLISDLTSGAKTRAQVLRAVAEDADFASREFNRAFVYMQYIGYLRRNANDPPDNNFDGYTFWLGKLNQFNGNFIQAEMVKAFIVSSEYRGRFAN
ncbi:MAG TPA: Calx-beta domain-containing protein, partial [Pyrinomonadaceae bacterium]|nr:Calx-beta domain-containing protein [Pyrinomonadaceae bacterium]